VIYVAISLQADTVVGVADCQKLAISRKRIGSELGSCSFICQGRPASTGKQRRDLCHLQVKLPPITTCLSTQR